VRRALTAAWILAGALVAARPADDLLAPMRAALGGDAVLGAVARFSITGTLTWRLSGNSSAGAIAYAVQSEFPDKFLMTTRSTADASGPGTNVLSPLTVTVAASGFNGDQPISRVSGDRFPGGMPSVIRKPGPTAPDEIAAAQRRQVSNARREFLRFVLPRFGKPFPGSLVKLEDAGRAAIEGRAVYQIKITDWGNRVHVLAVDAGSNLPVRLTWQDRPVVSMDLGTVINTGVALGAAPTLPKFPADPTAGMPDVDHVLTFKKFKVENGLNWPHEVPKTVDGKPTEDWTLGKANLSPKFKPGVFDPSK
jgi:hypothetical protein